MNAKEGADQVNGLLRDWLRKAGSLSDSNRRMGKREKYLSDQFRDTRGLRTQCVLEAVQANGVEEAQEHYYRALFSLHTDPAAALLYAKERQHLRPDPYITKLLPRLKELIELGASEGEDAEWPSLLAEVRRLERLRRRDRAPAWRCLKELILKALDRVEATGRRSKPALGEIAIAVGALAVIHRLAGRRDDAVDLLCHARPLALLAGAARVEAEWFRRSLYVLTDLSYLLRADDFAHKAMMLYAEAHAPEEVVRCQVDRAYVYYHAEEFRRSQEMLEAVLPRLPPEDTEYRISAHQILALNLHALGDLAGARAQLAIAIDLAGDDLFAKSYCLKTRGEILVAEGDVAGGLACYREVLPLFAKVTGAGELAELGMTCARLLLQEKRRPELRALAADLARWIHELKANQKLRLAILDFEALIRIDRLDERSIGEIVARVLEAKKLQRDRKVVAAARAQAKARKV